MKPKNYDYYLIVLTTIILFAIGIVCVYGITYYNYLSAVPGWTETTLYLQFIDNMNSYLYPFLVFLLISLGLCIPKRLFEQDILIKISALSLAATVILSFLLGMETAMDILLAVIAGIQGIVLIMTFNRNRAVRFEKEGYLVRMGSSMLHLGIVVLIFNFVTLRESQFHILIFWAGTLFVTAGNIFSFYPERMNFLFKR
ncbi:Uncharacterised protein [uncultured archaeon]|nr:Uncharacterised protein [uncultured archaeon]